MTVFIFTHASQRFDRGTQALRVAIRRHFKASSVLFLTEMHGRKKGIEGVREDLNLGYHGADQNAILWQKEEWAVLEFGSIVTPGKWLAKGGRVVDGLKTPYVVLMHRKTRVRGVFLGSHLPAGSESEYGKQDVDRKRFHKRHTIRVRNRANKLLRQYGTYKGEVYHTFAVNSADWNMNAKSETTRRVYFRRYLPGWTGWQKKWVDLKPGTHGGRLIDIPLVKRCVLLSIRVSTLAKESDHRAVTIRVAPKRRKGK